MFFFSKNLWILFYENFLEYLNKEHSGFASQIPTIAIIEELQEFQGPNYSVLGVDKMFRSDIRIVGPVTPDRGLSLHSVRTDYTSKAVSFRDNPSLDICKWSLHIAFQS